MLFVLVFFVVVVVVVVFFLLLITADAKILMFPREGKLKVFVTYLFVYAFFPMKSIERKGKCV